MTGLTLPASIAAALPGKVAAPSVLALGTAADGAPGVPSLAAFLDLMVGNTDVAPKGGASGDARQDDAATGKVLPQKPEEKGDPALAWLLSVAPIALPPLDPAKLVPMASGKTPSPIVAADGAAPALAAASAPAHLPLPSLATDALQPPATTDTAPTAPPPNARPVVDAKMAAPTAPIAVDTAAAATIPVPAAPRYAAKALAADGPAPTLSQAQPIRVALPAAAAPATATTAPAAAPAPLAARLAAGAPMPALFALATAPERDTRNDADTGSTGGIAAAAALLTPTDAAQLIAKPGGAHGQALDMGRQDWPQKMIDRIETLRDDANANDTSIRLKPDALGRVDVSLRTHADGGVSVHFAAEQPATRTLIADAAPQLNAAAEARGIRLAGTSVDLSGSGMAGGDRPRAQFELQQNSSNHLADGGDEIEAAGGGRIA